MKTGRKASGGKYRRGANKKKLHEKKGQPRIVKLAEIKKKLIKLVGGGHKLVTLSGEVANITKNGKAKKVKITNVLETPANRFLARQNILVKGAIIETEAGKAKITNRPSQEGTIQAVLMKE